MVHSLVRRCLAVLVLASLIIPSQALANEWGPPRPITDSGLAAAWTGGLAVSGNDDIQLVYSENFPGKAPGVFLRRSQDGGDTWLGPVQLGPDSATAPAVAASGPMVDVVYAQFAPDGKRRIKYRRSGDSGQTWSPTETLATLPAADIAPIINVARDGSDRVAVVWTNTSNGRILARVSEDGGMEFGPASHLGTTTNRPWDGFSAVREGFPDVAIAGGVVHVVFYTSDSVLQARRSSTEGETWKPVQTISNTGSGVIPSVAANGDTVLVGYANVTNDLWTVYRRSTNGGATWGTVTSLVGRSQPFGFQPIISFRDGVWRAVMERCTTESCTASMVIYRESADGGRTWTAASRVTPTSVPAAAPVGVSESEGLDVVAYLRYDTVDGPTDVYVRTGN